MNKEEAYNLEKGQEVFVRAIFTNITGDSEIRCITEDTDGTEWSIYSEFKHVFTALPTTNENATENKPKHDPTRLFKKGDEVRVVAWNGRDIARIGQIGRVVSDEHNSKVELAIDGWSSSVYYPACHLELVTPVEGLPTYRIGDFATNGEICVWRDQGGKTEKVCSFNVNTHPNALAAAEAERDRLNAQYRKEQNND